MPELLEKLESLDVVMVSSSDLLSCLHELGISAGYLPELYQQTSSHYLKKLLMTEMVSSVFTNMIRSELNHCYVVFPAEEFPTLNIGKVNAIIMDCIHMLFNELFSYSQRSENIWRTIVREADSRYRIIVSK